VNGRRNSLPQGEVQPARNVSLPSVWGNLLVFGLLVSLVLGMFFWQLDRTRKSMQQSSRERATMVASIIEADLYNAELARQTIDDIVEANLRDNGRFVQYLDAIEPFSAEELTAFARQAGLAGITIVRHSGLRISGPASWLPGGEECGAADSGIHYLPESRLGYLELRPEQDNTTIDCLYIGLDAGPILDLHGQISLPSLLATLSALPGIRYVRLLRQGEGRPEESATVRLLEDHGQFTAEAAIAIRQGLLVVGLDAHRFHLRISGLKNQFLVFSFVLFFLGLFFAWLLHRFQQASLEQTRRFERMLASEHEAAALGRATGTIAHEIRNPLNTINMGLQRLQWEVDNLNEEQQGLIRAMQGAVQRTSAIVTELLRFTRPLEPVRQPVGLGSLVREVTCLHQGELEARHIDLSLDLRCSRSLQGDEHLLAELLENLVRNAIEAQPDGGFLHIDLQQQENSLLLSLSNGPCSPDQEEMEQMLEPYYTTKTRGTGLGLPFCRRVAEAHGGNLEIEVDRESRTFRVHVRLPLEPRGSKEQPGSGTPAGCQHDKTG